MPIIASKNDLEITSGLGSYKQLDHYLLGSDLILMILLVGNVKGRTKMQKQTFIAWKELYHDKTFDPAFFPWKFGAYSEVVNDTLEMLEKDKYIRVKERRGEGSIYSLTELGHERIGRKLRRLKIDLEPLKSKKKDWDEWSPQGTLAYVYRKYPEYTSKTEVPYMKW